LWHRQFENKTYRETGIIQTFSEFEIMELQDDQNQENDARFNIIFADDAIKKIINDFQGKFSTSKGFVDYLRCRQIPYYSRPCEDKDVVFSWNNGFSLSWSASKGSTARISDFEEKRDNLYYPFNEKIVDQALLAVGESIETNITKRNLTHDKGFVL